MRVLNASEIPDSYKVKVYDALCSYFASTLPSYYTVDPDAPIASLYDSGATNEKTEVIGLEIEGDELYISIAIKGWADTHCFGVTLPALDRDQEYGESTGIEVD